MALQRVRGQLRSAGSGKFSTIHGLDQGAKSLHTHLTVSESFCARGGTPTSGRVERLDGGLVRRTPASILTESEAWMAPLIRDRRGSAGVYPTPLYPVH